MVKVISLSDKAYDLLKSMKLEGESFSDVINRVGQKRSIMEFAGCFKDNEEHWNKIKSKIRKDRDSGEINKLRSTH